MIYQSSQYIIISLGAVAEFDHKMAEEHCSTCLTGFSEQTALSASYLTCSDISSKGERVMQEESLYICPLAPGRLSV